MFEQLPLLQVIAEPGVFNDMLRHMWGVVPRLVFAMAIVLVGWIIAVFISRFLASVLSGMQADRLTDQLNDIDLVQRTGMRVRLSAIVAKMVYYVLMLGFVIFATDVLGIPVVTQMVRDLINYLPALFSGFVLFLLGLFLADIVRNIVRTTLQSLGLTSARLISNAVFYFLFLTAAVSALSQARIDTGFIATNLTVVIAAFALAFALGYGFAARDLVSNYLAGYYNRNKVRVGDEVRIIGMRGKVAMIDGTSLVLQTDDRAIVIPLSKLTTEKIEIFYPDAQTEQLLETGNARPTGSDL
jgi:small-conductance mechanosensitive channel